MRKHRLAECMLVQLLQMPWEEVHAEACRWEHVMSESVERRLLQILDHPTVSPYGNPIPGLEELDSTALVTPINIERMVPLNEACRDDVSRVIIRRIAEPIQDDADLVECRHENI